MKSTNWTYLGREAALLLLIAYVVLLGGGFTAMVEFRLQAFSTVLATALLGGWLFYLVMRGKSVACSGLELALLVFIGAQLAAVVFSEDVRRSLPHIITWLSYVLVFYFVLHLLRRGWPGELIEKCLLILGGLVTAFAMIQLSSVFMQWQSSTAGLEFVPSFKQRISSILGDPNLLAAFTNLLIPLALARAFVSGKVARLFLLILGLAGLVTLYFTDSRGGQLGLGAGLATLAVLWVLVVSERAKKQAQKIWNFVWSRKLVFGMLVAVVLAASAFAAWRVLSFEGDTTHAPVAEARNIYWQAALNAVSADPLTGAGPGMYPIYLLQIWSTPPARPYLHAHSLPFQVAAESGLLGLGAFLLLVGVVSRQAWTAWRSLQPADKARWAASLAALVGLGAHSLVDDFIPFPAVGVVAMVLLAFVLQAVPKAQDRRGGFSPLWLALPGLAAALFSAYALVGYSPAERGIAEAMDGDWPAADAESSTATCNDPAFALYWFQSGYAKARLALEDPRNYRLAIDDYHRGIVLEPSYALNHANLAALYWESGQEDEAIQEMRIATSLAPDAWLFWLNQGVYEEAQGDPEQASVSYELALNANSEIDGAAFWQRSPLRVTVVNDFAAPPAGDTAREQAAEAAQAGRAYIKSGQQEAAKQSFALAYELNDQEVRIYVGLAELAVAKVDLALAEQYIQAALALQATSNQVKIEAVLLGAEIAMAHGNPELALIRYEAAYQAIMSATSYGWGASGWTPYAYFAFQRRAFPEDLVPQMVRADISVETAKRLLPLAGLYTSLGEQENSQAVRTALQQYLP